MKKLFTLCTFALLLGYAAQTFAADIVVKTVRIKKRGVSKVKYPEDDRYTGIMTITSITDAKTSIDKIEVCVDVDVKRVSMGSVILEVERTDFYGKTTTITVDCKLNSAGLYEASYTVPLVAGSVPTLTKAIITAKAEGGIEVQYEAKLDKKDKEKDPCKEEYKLKEVTFLTDNVSGMYVMNFSFGFEKGENPDAVSMRVRLTDCKGATIILVIKLGYDAASGLYVGGQAIPQNKDCPWVLTYGEVYGANPCGDETTWATDFGTIKTSGAGTRSTTSTTKSTRPELK